MYILLNYKGQIRNNPLGMVYNFPHYSTILGSLLAVYHKQNQTPLFPRVDMLKQSAEIDLKLVYGYSRGQSRVVKDMILGTDYSTSNKNNKTLLAVNKTISSPLNVNIFEGNYYILLETNNSTLIQGLSRYMLSIGTKTEVPADYGLMGIFSDWDSVDSALKEKEILWVTMNQGSSKYVGLYLDEFESLGNLEDQGIAPILLSSPYTLDYHYLCAVSQIKWEDVSKESLQGLYLMFKIKKNLMESDLLSYKSLMTDTKNYVINIFKR